MTVFRLILDGPSMREMSAAEQRRLAVIGEGHPVSSVPP